MSDYKRLESNLDILERHNEIHTPIFHLTDGKIHEQDLIRDIISDCKELLNDLKSGKLVRLPCKEGDKVYMPWEYDGVSDVAELTVTSIDLNEKEIDTNLESDNYDYLLKYDFGVFWFKEIGEKIFLTKDEAKKKLKELKGEV